MHSNIRSLDLQKKLLYWYDRQARALPWRQNKDPYKIWVSEIMLQQTQVKTVIPYFLKWVVRFPTLKSLAEASLDQVMPYWAGLGYYRRARMLHEGVRFVLAQYGGRIPAKALELRKIPGIGRYTAGAISSIAFNEKSPVVDGNVIRVLTRLNAIRKDVGKTKVMKGLWKLAESLLPSKKVGDFNQALMELGATVCLPENPKCPDCPVNSHCAAFQKNEPEAYPVKSKREKIERLRAFSSVLIKKNKVLIQKQKQGERWGNLWMFPYWMKREAMMKDLGEHPRELVHQQSLNHHFTKYKIRLEVSHYQVKDATNVPFKRTKWVAFSDLKKYAFPSHHRKIADTLIEIYA